MPGRGTVFSSVYFVKPIKEADFAQAVKSMVKENMLTGRQFEELMESEKMLSANP